MTVDDIFKCFGSATALGEAIGRNAVRAAEMRSRGSIAPKYWARLVDAARDRGFDDITFEALAEAHARDPHESKGADIERPTPIPASSNTNSEAAE